MGALLQNLSIPRHYAPTFRCTNIQLTHGLEVSLAVEYAWETFNLAFDVGAVTVLAAEHIIEERAKEGMGYMNPAGKNPRFIRLWKVV